MRRRVVAILLLAPFGLIPVIGNAIADRQATGVAGALSEVARALESVESTPETRDQEQVARWRAELAAMFDEPASATELGSRADRSRRTSRAVGQVPRGLFVSAEQVLRLSRVGVRPSGIPVRSAGGRPGGLLLSGVSGLGVGLRDGDILTHALGQPAVSEEMIVGAVIRARGARQAQLSGQVWRDGHVFPLIVAQPYLDSG